jgi:hypothetical protein
VDTKGTEFQERRNGIKYQKLSITQDRDRILTRTLDFFFFFLCQY